MKKRVIENLILLFIAALMLLLMIQFDKIYYDIVMNSDLSDFAKNILIERG